MHTTVVGSLLISTPAAPATIDNLIAKADPRVGFFASDDWQSLSVMHAHNGRRFPFDFNTGGPATIDNQIAKADLRVGFFASDGWQSLSVIHAHHGRRFPFDFNTGGPRYPPQEDCRSLPLLAPGSWQTMPVTHAHNGRRFTFDFILTASSPCPICRLAAGPASEPGVSACQRCWPFYSYCDRYSGAGARRPMPGSLIARSSGSIPKISPSRLNSSPSSRATMIPSRP